MNNQTDALIIGAGPAGCAAACALVDAGISVVVLDKLDQPGGLARSINRNGNIFDIGPHRFFTKSDEVLGLWRNYLREDLISVNRLTRILYKGKLFNYPLSPMNALLGLGIGTATHAFANYGLTKLKRVLRPRAPVSFEDWVSDNFGTVSIRSFFPALYRKGLGNTLRTDKRRLGVPKNQRTEPLQSRLQCVHKSQKLSDQNTRGQICIPRKRSRLVIH